MQFLTLYWWEWLAYAFGYSSCLSVAVWLWWMQRKDHSRLGEIQSISSLATIVPEMQPVGKQTVWIASITGLICLVAGYGIHEIEHYRGMQTLADVLVLDRYSDSHYRLQTSWGQAFDATICPDSDVDWEKGERLQILNYEQHHGCKSLRGRNLGYVVYTNQDGSKLKLEEVANVTR